MAPTSAARSAFKPPRSAQAESKASSAQPQGTDKVASHRPHVAVLSSSSSASPSPSPPAESALKAARPATRNARAGDIQAAPSPLPPDVDVTTSPSIPTALLTQLLHAHFDNPATQITKAAMAGVQMYTELFVREALARADAERVERNRVSEEHGEPEASQEPFVEIDDLERLAPQLLLDF